MKTKKDFFYRRCGNLETLDGVLYDLRERRYELLDEMCESMNDIFVSEIKGLGFPDAHFYINDFGFEPGLSLMFDERWSRANFETEEEWLDYQSRNIRICYDYFKEECPGLDIICLPRDEDDP